MKLDQIIFGVKIPSRSKNKSQRKILNKGNEAFMYTIVLSILIIYVNRYQYHIFKIINIIYP